jgi:hypothetical protein
VVEEMAADKEQPQSAPSPEHPIAKSQPNLDQPRVKLGLFDITIKEALDSSMAYNNTAPAPVSLDHGRKRECNGPKKKGGLTSSTNDKRRKNKKLDFGSPGHKSPKEDTWHKHHIRGEFLVPQKVYDLLPSKMKVLHDDIISVETTDGSNATQYTAKVPGDYHFFAEDSTGTFTLEFKDIFSMYNLGLLSASLIRLWVLFQAKETRQLKVGICGVANPFHMHSKNASTEEGRSIMKESLASAMLRNKDKHFLLVPYVIS